MRRIDQSERSATGGGGLYPRPLMATADVETSAGAAQAVRNFPDIVIRSMTHLRGPNAPFCDRKAARLIAWRLSFDPLLLSGAEYTLVTLGVPAPIYP